MPFAGEDDLGDLIDGDIRKRQLSAGMSYRKLRPLPLDHIYLWLCAPLLLAMVYILPPFQAPDEVAHYYRAIQISHEARGLGNRTAGEGERRR